MNTFSRRDFLKVTSASLLGVLSSGLNLSRAFARNYSEDAFGRVINSFSHVYESPSFASKSLGRVFLNNVIDIRGWAEEDDRGTPNRIWYKLDQGYIHSTQLQPVKTTYNATVQDIPRTGAVGEITVPFVYSYKAPRSYANTSYIYFYGTTYYVRGFYNVDGLDWYWVYDDSLDKDFYVEAKNMRIYTPAELAPISPNVPQAEKRIVVGILEQLVLAFEGNQLVFTARASTGAKGFETPIGTFTTYHKCATSHMTPGGLAADGYDLPGVPWVSFINSNGVSFHGTYWHNDYGTPHSHGCINLRPEDSRWIYQWTLPVMPDDKYKLVVEKDAATIVHILDKLPGHYSDWRNA